MRANRSQYLLYGQQKPGMVRGIPLGSQQTQTEVIIPMVDLSRPTAMDFHAKSNHLYLADSQRLKIERQDLELGTKEDFISKGLLIVLQFLVDTFPICETKDICSLFLEKVCFSLTPLIVHPFYLYLL